MGGLSPWKAPINQQSDTSAWMMAPLENVIFYHFMVGCSHCATPISGGGRPHAWCQTLWIVEGPARFFTALQAHVFLFKRPFSMSAGLIMGREFFRAITITSALSVCPEYGKPQSRPSSVLYRPRLALPPSAR